MELVKEEQLPQVVQGRPGVEVGRVLHVRHRMEELHVV